MVLVKRIIKMLTVSLAVVFLLGACSDSSENADSDDAGGSNDKLQLMSSFSIITDMLEEIGGDQVEVHNLVPIGTDPHDYEPKPEDTMDATDADAMFYNGLNLEGGEDGWFYKLANSADQDKDHIFELAEDVDPMYLQEEDKENKEVNPHAFIDPAVGIKMTKSARDALIELDPDHKEEYEDNADQYLKKINDIDQEYEEKIDDIPKEDRILVTSERAFQYMADHYGLDEGYIWAIDTEENGTPEQISSLVEFIKEKDVPALFVETNVDTRPMETVSDETGVDIEGEIFSDEIGKPGEEGDTYLSYLKYNIDEIHDVLAK